MIETKKSVADSKERNKQRNIIQERNKIGFLL